MNRELWEHQSDALLALRQSFVQGVRRIVVSAPTGSGKTLLAAAIIEGALEKRNRVAFVVSNISLVDQTVEVLYANGIRDVGVIQADHSLTNWSRPVQVASIQTIKSRGVYPEAQVVIIDEVHVLHDAHKEWITNPEWQQKYFIGLSATPYTRGLGKYFETMIVVGTTQEMIDKGILCPFSVFATGHPDLSKVRTIAGDYHEGELSEAMQAGELMGDIVKTWMDKWGKDKTLFFGVDCAHAQNVQDRFNQAGISCGYQDAHTPLDERRDIKRKFHSGEFRVVSNVGTLTTGTDWDCRCLILGRPTKSEILFKQIVGRGLRVAEGKDKLVFLDHTDTTLHRLGFVTDIEHFELDNGTPADKATARAAEKKAPPLPKECKSCGAIKPSRVRICPNCGQAPKAESSVIERDGELVEVTGGKKVRAKQRKASDYSAPERQVFLAELKAHAAERGYKAGWAAFKFKEKFGAWPPDGMKQVAPASAVSALTKSWIKSTLIRWAHSRKAEPSHVD